MYLREKLIQETVGHWRVNCILESSNVIWKGIKFRWHQSHGKFYGLLMKLLFIISNQNKCFSSAIDQNDFIALKSKFICSISLS